MKNLQIFKNEEFGQIRAISIEDEPWFIGKDVVNALGYDLTNHSYTKYINRYCLEQDLINYNEKTQSQVGLELDYKSLGQRGGLLINEYALYDLVLDSPLPSAKTFKKWVTHEVLPTIRQTGGYVSDGKEEEFVNKYFPSFSEEVKLGMIQDLMKKNKELKVGAEKYKQFMDTDGTFGFRELCKHLNGLGYNLKETELRTILKDDGIICKQGAKYVVSQEGVRNGYGLLKDNIVDNANRPTTRYTEKLRDYLIKKLA